MVTDGILWLVLFFFLEGGAVAQSVERAAPGEEVPGSIPAVAVRSSTGWVGVSVMWPAETEVIVSQLCVMCGST